MQWCPCNKHKQFLISYKMVVSFRLNSFDFPPLSLSTVSKPVSSVPASLSVATACRSSSDISPSSHKSLSDATKVCGGTVCSSNVYSSKPIHPSKPVCLSNTRTSKPISSSNFHLSKRAFPRNISLVDLFVQVMFVKIKIMIIQVNPFVQVMFAQGNSFVQAVTFQVNPFVQTMLFYVKLLIQVNFIPINLLVLVIFFQINLFAYVIFV